MKAVLPVCLVLAAALLAWAVLVPADPPSLPEDLVGHYRVVRYEPGAQMEDKVNPFPEDQTQIYEFRANSTYLRQQLVLGKVEMWRAEGRVVSPADGQLELVRISADRQPIAPNEYRQLFDYRWQRTPEGRVLRLTHAEQGYELYLRRE
ncbi:MAG: hypothetical protein O7E54_13945 [Planctomycetota bacterium]|nr:hypothetical protein [Planctomycetota bacterium]